MWRLDPWLLLRWFERAARCCGTPQVNHARNVWDRAVSILPRIDQLWYKYIHMEEMLGNVAGARQARRRRTPGRLSGLQGLDPWR